MSIEITEKNKGFLLSLSQWNTIDIYHHDDGDVTIETVYDDYGENPIQNSYFILTKTQWQEFKTAITNLNF